MQAVSGWNRLVHALRDAVFPARCYGCGRLYHPPGASRCEWAQGSRDRLLRLLFADVLCGACATIDWVESPMCPACGRPFVTTKGVDHLCASCQEGSLSFDGARAVGSYSQALPLLVTVFKYHGLVQLAAPLGQLMWHTLLGCHDLEAFDRLIPVPLHWRQKRHRGFNQTELLMVTWPELAKDAGMTLETDKIALKALTRTRNTLSQTGLGPIQRKNNLKHAFRVSQPDQVRGCRILLVDDVLTTGATADACALALKRAGADAVHVLTLARAV